MFRYGKTTQHAVAAMSRLAELYADPDCKASSAEIARDRHLSQPLVAKLLTILSQEGLVSGAPGPGGGYRLARDPSKIDLYMVARVFERGEKAMGCPFGERWCGRSKPCPLHDKLVALSDRMNAFLKKTTLDVFTREERSRKARKRKGA